MSTTHIEVIDVDGDRHLLPVSMVEIWEDDTERDCACIATAGSVRVFTHQPYEHFRKLLLGEDHDAV